jgi:TPR repeat protein
MESLTGKKTYPDPFNVRPIRDTTEHILRTFSLDSIYRMAAGKPGRGKNVAEHFLADIKSLLVYRSDPGEQAYYDTRKMVFDWLGAQGVERPSGTPTKRGNALYYYRQALKYGDFSAAKRYLGKYYEMGGTGRTLRQGIKGAHPLASIPSRKRYSFRQSLGPQDAQRLKQALEWYELTYKQKDTNLRQEVAAKRFATVNQ